MKTTFTHPSGTAKKQLKTTLTASGWFTTQAESFKDADWSNEMRSGATFFNSQSEAEKDHTKLANLLESAGWKRDNS